MLQRILPRCLEIDTEGGQGPPWTIESVERVCLALTNFF